MGGCAKGSWMIVGWWDRLQYDMRRYMMRNWEYMSLKLDVDIYISDGLEWDNSSIREDVDI